MIFGEIAAIAWFQMNPMFKNAHGDYCEHSGKGGDGLSD